MKWMTMREFLRGGYRDIEEPTVVSIHGRPEFTVFPSNSTTWTNTVSQINNSATSTNTSTIHTPVRSDLPTEDEL